MLEPVPVRALSSITAQQADAIVDVVQKSGLHWTVQTMVDYEGYLSLMIEPCAEGDGQTALFVSGTAQCLELFQNDDDALVALDTFTALEPLVARLQDLIWGHHGSL